MAQNIKLAIIGGSGLYDLPDVTVLEELDIETPFGKTSSSITIIELDGIKAAFLPRHGKGHTILPSDIPVKANIYALKSLGVDKVIAINPTKTKNTNFILDCFLLLIIF